MAGDALQQLDEFGVAIWLDDLDRGRISEGGLERLVAHQFVTGVTTNPAIFQKALASGPWYHAHIERLRAAGYGNTDLVWDLIVADVQAACDLLHPVWQRTNTIDGRVSIEVDPRLAHDTAGTVQQAAELWARVDRPNALVKIPATPAGLPAITQAIAQGISVNVTLIFSVDRYREVMDAYANGLRAARQAGIDLSTITSVASFFVSRVDTEIDERIARAGLPDHLRGRAAIANARLAWGAYEEVLSGSTWQELAHAGAHPQRPLWASTGVKNPDYDATRYVVDLAVPGSVNTMPESTLDAVRSQGVFRGDRVRGEYADAQRCFDELVEAGIDMPDVFATLERDGVEKFISAWTDLLDHIDAVTRD